MKQRFLIAIVMLIMLTTPLSTQAQDGEWQFNAIQLYEREQIVHSRSFNWNPLDHTDNKTCFEFEVPVNTVAIMYAYCSRMSETSVPALQILSGITQCIGSVSSIASRNLGEGINKIAEGLNGMSLPSGTGDVDIFLFSNCDSYHLFREASTSDCESGPFYNAKYDVLNQKSGTKTIKYNSPIEKEFTLYLGLLNKDMNDAITVRIEAIAITAKKVSIAKPEEPAVTSNAMTMSTAQSKREIKENAAIAFAKELDSDNSYLFNIGMEYYMENDYEIAFQFFDKINVSDKTILRIMAHYYKGQCRYYQVQNDKALINYKRAVNYRVPSNAEYCNEIKSYQNMAQTMINLLEK